MRAITTLADGDLVDDILNLRFQTLAGTLMYSRTDRPAVAGYGVETSPGVWEISPDTSGILMVSLDQYGNPIPRNYRDPDGPQWWCEYEIDYAALHNFEINDGNAGVVESCDLMRHRHDRREFVDGHTGLAQGKVRN